MHERGDGGGGEERECHLVPFRHWEERVFSGEHGAADEDAGKDDVHEVGVVDDMMTEHSHSVTGKSNGLHTPKQRKVVTPRTPRETATEVCVCTQQRKPVSMKYKMHVINQYDVVGSFGYQCKTKVKLYDWRKT